MSKVGQIERATQNRIVKLFRDQLGLRLSRQLEERLGNRNIEEATCVPSCSGQATTTCLSVAALYELDKAAGDQTKSLYDVNKDVYSLLRYGVKVKPEVGENTETVWLIDWQHPLNNHFAVAEEVTVTGEHTKRRHRAVRQRHRAGRLELKRSIVSVSEGIRQNLATRSRTSSDRSSPPCNWSWQATTSRACATA